MILGRHQVFIAARLENTDFFPDTKTFSPPNKIITVAITKILRGIIGPTVSECTPCLVVTTLTIKAVLKKLLPVQTGKVRDLLVVALQQS